MSEPEDEESTFLYLENETDERSDFAKAFEDDIIFQTQERMIAKAKTKKFKHEDFVEKAKNDLPRQRVIKEKVEELEETPEPPSEEDDFFLFF